MKIAKIMKFNAVIHHLHGNKHSFAHKSICGIFVMFVGVFIAKSASIFEIEFMHYTMDVAGYFIHGFGALPFVEQLCSEN